MLLIRALQALFFGLSVFFCGPVLSFPSVPCCWACKDQSGSGLRPRRYPRTCADLAHGHVQGLPLPGVRFLAMPQIGLYNLGKILQDMKMTLRCR